MKSHCKKALCLFILWQQERIRASYLAVQCLDMPWLPLTISSSCFVTEKQASLWPCRKHAAHLNAFHEIIIMETSRIFGSKGSIGARPYRTIQHLSNSIARKEPPALDASGPSLPSYCGWLHISYLAYTICLVLYHIIYILYLHITTYLPLIAVCMCARTILHVTWTNPIAISVSRVGSLQQFSPSSFAIQPPACAVTIFFWQFSQWFIHQKPGFD